MEVKRLVRRFRTGDAEAVREMYDRYGRAVFAVALRTLGDRALAEDAVQQTFLQAWRAADRLDPERDPAAWLFTIARRAAIDVYRRERRHDHRNHEETQVVTLPESIETAWHTWEVRRALDELPAEELAVVRATHFMGYTHAETAELLGVPVGTVKSRSHRAHRRLAIRLAHLEEAIA